jgi:hypothetical protein
LLLEVRNALEAALAALLCVVLAICHPPLITEHLTSPYNLSHDHRLLRCTYPCLSQTPAHRCASIQ